MKTPTVANAWDDGETGARVFEMHAPGHGIPGVDNAAWHAETPTSIREAHGQVYAATYAGAVSAVTAQWPGAECYPAGVVPPATLAYLSGDYDSAPADALGAIAAALSFAVVNQRPEARILANAALAAHVLYSCQ